MNGSKEPLDNYPYARDSRSRPAAPDLSDGNYVFVQDMDGVVYVVPDGPHQHPRVLGGGRPARYAGDLVIEKGIVVAITNCSGTFQFDDPEGLCEVVVQLRRQGLNIKPGCVRRFPNDGGPVEVLE